MFTVRIFLKQQQQQGQQLSFSMLLNLSHCKHTVNIGRVGLCSKNPRKCPFKKIWLETTNQKNQGGGKGAGG